MSLNLKANYTVGGFWFILNIDAIKIALHRSIPQDFWYKINAMLLKNRFNLRIKDTQFILINIFKSSHSKSSLCQN